MGLGFNMEREVRTEQGWVLMFFLKPFFFLSKIFVNWVVETFKWTDMIAWASSYIPNLLDHSRLNFPSISLLYDATGLTNAGPVSITGRYKWSWIASEVCCSTPILNDTHHPSGIQSNQWFSAWIFQNSRVFQMTTTLLSDYICLHTIDRQKAHHPLMKIYNVKRYIKGVN